MNQERIYKVILQPHMSEKATMVADKARQIVFKVLLNAQKAEIKEAVEKLYNVKVQSVKTAVMKGKTRRFGRFNGVRSDWKKAYVKLEEGHDINFMIGEAKG